MESPFAVITRGLGAFSHVVPERYRNAATELAALLVITGKPFDPDVPHELIFATPRDARTIADMVVAGLQKRNAKQRREIAHWAGVLLTLRSGKTEVWEQSIDRRVDRNVRRRR
jgi:hypothetical protein